MMITMEIMMMIMMITKVMIRIVTISTMNAKLTMRIE